MRSNESSSHLTSKIEGHVFSKAENYLKEKFVDLENNYRREGSKYVDHCGLIAIEVARLIISEGGQPSLLMIKGRKVDSVGNTESLKPKRYNGEVEWGAHTVCENDNKIYDPMVGKSLSRVEYLETIFLSPVEAKVLVPNKEIDEFIQR